MNLDNQRLKEIQQLKHAYGTQILASDSKAERKHYYQKIDELSEEEKQILERCDVIL
jgi:hypothetical protein